MQKPVKIISFFLFVCISTMLFGQSSRAKTSYSIKENLDFPFGTLIKLKIEIIDGTSLKQKSLNGIYLMKINEINDQPFKESFITEFIDKSGEFPTEDFGLYEKVYKKKVKNSLSSDEIDKIQKNYVGKTFTVLAYESGKFVGIPNESDFVKKKVNLPRLMKQDVIFHFKNYIVIESKLPD